VSGLSASCTKLTSAGSGRSAESRGTAGVFDGAFDSVDWLSAVSMVTYALSTSSATTSAIVSTPSKSSPNLNVPDFRLDKRLVYLKRLYHARYQPALSEVWLL